MGLTVEQMKENVREFERREQEKDREALNRSYAEMTAIIRRLHKRGFTLATEEAKNLKMLLAHECYRSYKGEVKR